MDQSKWPIEIQFNLMLMFWNFVWQHDIKYQLIMIIAIEIKVFMITNSFSKSFDILIILELIIIFVKKQLEDLFILK